MTRPIAGMAAALALSLGLAMPAAAFDPASMSDAEKAAFGQAVRDYLMANPEVLHASAQPRDHEEASPNLPGVFAKITRPRAVTVRFLNADGVIEDRDFVNLWATSVQHQIDHLNGKMYFDNLSKIKRDMLLKKARKAP